MAAKIHELRAKWEAMVQEANAALEAAQALATKEERALTEEELSAQADFDTKIEAAKSAYTLEASKNARLADLGGNPVPGSTVTVGAPRADKDPQKGFGSHVEFFTACIDNSGLRDRDHVDDDRLKPLAVMDKEDKVAAGELAFMLPTGFTPKAAVGSDEQGEYSDTYGGFAVPTSRVPGLLQVGFEGDPTAGMTMSIPMASPSVEIMARTDKDHSDSVSGGFTVARRSETVAPTASRMALEMIGLKAASLFGLAYATEEILQDSAVSFAAMIDSGFRSQFGAKILDEKIRGGGGNEYHGILGAACAISVAKESGQSADTIVFDNVNKMAARSWGYGQAVWLANHNTRPQLAKITLPVGTGGVAMYQPASVPNALDMLMGRPVVYSEYMSTLGDLGDIALVNWSQYLEGTYQPIQGAESIHVRFVNHERTFKLWTRNCGAPWWRTALTPNKGDTLSPIVTLAARA